MIAMSKEDTITGHTCTTRSHSGSTNVSEGFNTKSEDRLVVYFVSDCLSTSVCK